MAKSKEPVKPKSKAPATPKAKEPVKPKAPVKKKDEELLKGLIAVRTAMTSMDQSFGDIGPDGSDLLYVMRAPLRNQLVDLIDQMIEERN